MEQADRRAARLLQAVNVFAKLPFEIELPPVGAVRELAYIQGALHCSRTTAFKLARTAGVEPRSKSRGWYTESTTVTITPALADGMQAWAAAPRTRLTRADFGI